LLYPENKKSRELNLLHVQKINPGFLTLPYFTFKKEIADIKKDLEAFPKSVWYKVSGIKLLK